MKFLLKKSGNYLLSIVPLIVLITFFSFEQKEKKAKPNLTSTLNMNHSKDLSLIAARSVPCGFITKGVVSWEQASFTPSDSAPVLQNPSGTHPPSGLNIPDHIFSAGGNDMLQLQPDGNLVITCMTCTPTKALWSSVTNGQRGGTGGWMALYLQTDGNLVLHDIHNNVIWNSGIHRSCPNGNGGQYTLQDDGNLVDLYVDPPSTFPNTTYYLGGSSNAGNQSISTHFGKIE